MEKLKVLQIVIKNTSTLDFTLPLIWYIKHNNVESEVSILYCVSNKNKILDRSKFYSDEFKKLGVRELDFLSFFPDYFKFLKPALYNIFSVPDSDNETFLELSLSKNSFLSNAQNWIKYIGQKLRKIIEKEVIKSYLDINKEINAIKPDVILLDNREKVSFPGDRDLFNDIFQTYKSQVVLLPHAPHYLTSDFSHVNPNSSGNFSINYKYDIWMPFAMSDPCSTKPELNNQLFYSGYPGFDSEWIKYTKSIISKKRHKVSILYIGRKFLNKDVQRPDNYNFVTMDYNEMLLQINSIHDSLEELGIEFELIYKAHPSSNAFSVEKMLNESNMTEFTVSFDASYSFLGQVDLVISPYSTALFSFSISGIPTIVLKSKMMDEAISYWKTVAELYENMSYYCDQNNIKRVINSIIKNNDNGAMDDIEHIRKYFPDNSLNLCYARILNIKNNNK